MPEQIPLIALIDSAEPPGLRDAMQGKVIFLHGAMPEASVLIFRGDAPTLDASLKAIRSRPELLSIPVLAWGYEPVDPELADRCRRRGIRHLVLASQLPAVLARHLQRHVEAAPSAPAPTAPAASKPSPPRSAAPAPAPAAPAAPAPAAPAPAAPAAPAPAAPAAPAPAAPAETGEAAALKASPSPQPEASAAPTPEAPVAAQQESATSEAPAPAAPTSEPSSPPRPAAAPPFPEPSPAEPGENPLDAPTELPWAPKVSSIPSPRNLRAAGERPALVTPEDPSARFIVQWLLGTLPYLQRRNVTWSRMGYNAESEWFELCHLRDRARSTTMGEKQPSEYSLGRSGFRVEVGFPVWLSAPLDTAALLVNVGMDGVCFQTEQQLAQPNQITCVLSIEDQEIAELTTRARWQKRTSRSRWLVGTILLDIDLKVDPKALMQS